MAEKMKRDAADGVKVGGDDWSSAGWEQHYNDDDEFAPGDYQEEDEGASFEAFCPGCRTYQEWEGAIGEHRELKCGNCRYIRRSLSRLLHS